MNRIEQAVQEAKKKLADNEKIFAAILYGSVSRGDYSLRHSDIDILIITEGKNTAQIDKTIEEINAKYRVKIHPEYQTSKIKPEDQTLLCKMFEEGKILFSKGIWLMNEKALGLSAYRLYKFDTTELSKSQRVMVSRALHERGLIDKTSVIDSGRGGLLVRKDRFEEIEQFFNKTGIRYKIIKTVYG